MAIQSDRHVGETAAPSDEAPADELSNTAPGFDLSSILKSALPPGPPDTELMSLVELGARVSLASCEVAYQERKNPLGLSRADWLVVRMLLGDEPPEGSPASRLNVYRQTHWGTELLSDQAKECDGHRFPSDRESTLRELVMPLICGRELRNIEGGAYLAIKRADAVAAFGLHSEVALANDCAATAVRSTAVPVGPSIDGALSVVLPVGGGWPHMRGNWSDAEREAMFKMRHLKGMTGENIATVVRTSRQRVDELIGNAMSPRTGIWPRVCTWRPSPALLLECGLQSSTPLQVVAQTRTQA
jgi:hypothetical protein